MIKEFWHCEGDLGHGVSNKPNGPVPQVGPQVAGFEEHHILGPGGPSLAPVAQVACHFLQTLQGALGLRLVPADNDQL